MNDVDVETLPAEPVADSPVMPPDGCGAALRRRREAMALSPADAAAQLKITPRRVEALEAERWAELPDGPFLRGLVRNYAKLLELDAESLIAQIPERAGTAIPLDRILNAPSLHAPMPRSGASTNRIAPGLLLLGLVIVVLGLGIYFWVGPRSFESVESVLSLATQALSGQKKPAANAVATAPVRTGDTVSHSVALTLPDPEPDRQNDIALLSDTTVVPAAVDDAAPAMPRAGEHAAQPGQTGPLTISFHGESWIEVRQADGSLLMSGVRPANSEQTLAGQAPFAIVIGNASGVSVTFRGERVDLAPYVRDRVARLTLG